MARIFPIEAANSDTTIGGFVVEFPSGHREQVAWKREAPVLQTRDSAKALVIELVDKCIKQGLIDDVERTNITSLVAAVEALTIEWNKKRTASLHAEGDVFRAAQTESLH